MQHDDDDRRHCYECRKAQSSPARYGTPAFTSCKATGLRVMDDLPRRCTHYLPTTSDPDQRPGKVRFAWIVREREREKKLGGNFPPIQPKPKRRGTA